MIFCNQDNPGTPAYHQVLYDFPHGDSMHRLTIRGLDAARSVAAFSLVPNQPNTTFELCGFLDFGLWAPLRDVGVACA